MAWVKQESEDDGIRTGDNGTYWSPMEGTSIEGVIKGFGQDDYGNEFIYLTVEGVEDPVQLPSHLDLVNKTKKVIENDQIKVILKEMKDVGKKNPMRIYEVYKQTGD